MRSVCLVFIDTVMVVSVAVCKLVLTHFEYTVSLFYMHYCCCYVVHTVYVVLMLYLLHYYYVLCK